jgi:hypothetical protein
MRISRDPGARRSFSAADDSECTHPHLWRNLEGLSCSPLERHLLPTYMVGNLDAKLMAQSCTSAVTLRKSQSRDVSNILILLRTTIESIALLDGRAIALLIDCPSADL